MQDACRDWMCARKRQLSLHSFACRKHRPRLPWCLKNRLGDTSFVVVVIVAARIKPCLPAPLDRLQRECSSHGESFQHAYAPCPTNRSAHLFLSRDCFTSETLTFLVVPSLRNNNNNRHVDKQIAAEAYLKRRHPYHVVEPFGC